MLTDEEIPLKDAIGKTITNIYMVSGIEDEWLDTAESWIELDNSILVDFPLNHGDSLTQKEFDLEAESIFKTLKGKFIFLESKELACIQNSKIVNFIWNDSKMDWNGCIELDNGYIMRYRYMSPMGTGIAGIHFYKSFEELVQTIKLNFERAF